LASQKRSDGTAVYAVVLKRSINLTFHGIGEPRRPLEAGEGDVWLGRDRFLALLDSVAGRRDVRITFDDGNASDLEEALPALRDRDLHASFFVVAGRLAEPEFLDAGAVRELAAAGMGIGCHGMRHRPWRGLDDNRLHEELVEAKAILEEIIEGPVTEAACPFGSYDRRVLRTLRRSGYSRVYTSDRGTCDPCDFLQPRNTVGPADEGDVVSGIESLAGSPHNGLGRRAKLAVKRWR
jgi:peptidoglycan/xylan/chitin deacetylase (PgdA/CDA1 family)